MFSMRGGPPASLCSPKCVPFSAARNRIPGIGAGDALSPEEVARFGPAAIVRANVILGVVAVAGTVGGQLLLGGGQKLPADVLSGMAIVVAMWAFRRSTDFALPAVGDHEQLRRFNSFWLLAVVLVPGAAAANGMSHVVDPGQQSMFVLDPGGQEIAQVRRSKRRFSEPVDVATDASGNIYVLDAGDGGQVSVHGAAGDYVRAVPLSDNIADRSRGIDVDGEGRIWLALTHTLAVAAFDVEGRELARISTVIGEGDFQPVDVSYHADYAVYVSKVGTAAVIRFSLGGEPLNLRPLARANSADGPHMAVDEAGTLYVAQPE